jgi:hypothetical protein
MADAVFGAAREVWMIVLGALTNPGPYLVAALVLIAAASAIFVKGKLGAMVWVPLIAVAGFVAWRYLGL